MGVDTIDVLGGNIYCDVRTTARMGYVFSFNRNKAWEQHVAEDGPSDVIGIANNCGIPKGFAVYGATAEFGIEPLLCTENYIRSGESVLLGWPVILQAYVCHQSANVGQFVPNMSSALFQGNGIDTRSTQGNMAFQLYTDGNRHVLEPMHL
ncbi:hypothetical protein SCLCIDRAFT_1213572 [Scleroderma citrinum Foug A]|uniref:Uncharacterized protein n=1 Tax=Scleroderma citrinum Foug A TaxID=1036808 RepID=A0A0C3E852_9AGAM|nr:hypothetical protein SCLCIDRAFT_1213572 [Scleroderma citrinum Foug A]